MRTHTTLRPLPYCPEIHLHLAHDPIAVWQATEDHLATQGLPPPFWACAWAGGQALARYVLDHPAVVCGKAVFDFASGSGLVAIAAAMAGAARVYASEIDACALTAMALNAQANHVTVERIGADVLATPALPVDVILAGDVCYAQPMAARVFAWLTNAQRAGASILLGDPGRTYLPQDRLDKVCEYAVPVLHALEDTAVKQTSVWRLRVPSDPPRPNTTTGWPEGSAERS